MKHFERETEREREREIKREHYNKRDSEDIFTSLHEIDPNL